MLTFRWKYKKLKQIEIVECLGHLYRTRSQAFACSKMASAQKKPRQTLLGTFFSTGELECIFLACVAADSFPFSGGAEIEQANEKRASEGARLG